jgi:hypothetical protein
MKVVLMNSYTTELLDQKFYNATIEKNATSLLISKKKILFIVTQKSNPLPLIPTTAHVVSNYILI